MIRVMTECKMTQSALAMALALTSHSSRRLGAVPRLRLVPDPLSLNLLNNKSPKKLKTLQNEAPGPTDSIPQPLGGRRLVEPSK